MGNEVLLWVFLAVGRDRKVVDGSKRGGAGGCWERDKGGKNERKGKKKVSEFKSWMKSQMTSTTRETMLDPKLFSLLGYFTIFFNGVKENSTYYLIV